MMCGLDAAALRADDRVDLDAGTRAIKILQADVRDGKILRCLTASMDAGSTDAAGASPAPRIAGLLRRRGFHGHNIVLAIPPHLLRMEAVELPKILPAAVHQLAEMEIGSSDLPNVAASDELRQMLNKANVPDFDAVARTGVGVFDTLKAVAKLVLTELKKGGGG